MSEPNRKPIVSKSLGPPTPLPITPGRRPFRLFRSTSTSNRCHYVGSLTMPDGRCYQVEANLVVDESGAKSFEGEVFAVNPSRLLEGATYRGAKPPLPENDLVAAAEAAPFDDPLPEFKP